MRSTARTVRLLPLEERRARLRKALRGASKAVEGDGAAIFRHACALGLEGIVSKRRDSRYRSGRSLTWLKIKNRGPTMLPSVPWRPRTMSAVATGLGAQICSTAQLAGVTALRCYDAATHRVWATQRCCLHSLIAGWRGLGRQTLKLSSRGNGPVGLDMSCAKAARPVTI